jgi:hypothetical protein
VVQPWKATLGSLYWGKIVNYWNVMCFLISCLIDVFCFVPKELENILNFLCVYVMWTFCYSLYELKKIISHQVVAAHACDPSTGEAEAGRFLSLRPAWSTEWVPGQPGLHRETLPRKTKTKTTTTQEKNTKKKQKQTKRMGTYYKVTSCMILKWYP